MGSKQELIIDTLALTTANTEYSYELPANTEKFRFQLRDTSVKLRVSHIAGKVAASTDPFFTIPADAGWEEDDLRQPRAAAQAREDGMTVYFATPTASQKLEVMVWTGLGRSS